MKSSVLILMTMLQSLAFASTPPQESAVEVKAEFKTESVPLEEPTSVSGISDGALAINAVEDEEQMTEDQELVEILENL